jgi:hypothetical protein
VSKEFVYQKFRQAIKNDALLAKEFGDAEKLEQALDNLIVMYPPVPKSPHIPYSGAVKAATADKDSKSSPK